MTVRLSATPNYSTQLTFGKDNKIKKTSRKATKSVEKGYSKVYGDDKDLTAKQVTVSGGLTALLLSGQRFLAKADKGKGAFDAISSNFAGKKNFFNGKVGKHAGGVLAVLSTLGGGVTAFNVINGATHSDN